MLIESLYEPFVFINKAIVNDGEGGIVATYVEGAQFMAAITPDGSMKTAIKNIGMKNVLNSTWVIATPENISLKYGDIVKHKSTGQAYRITDKEVKAATIASYKFNKVTAEEWEIPDE